MNNEELAQWGARRDLGQETLDGINDLQAGEAGRRFMAHFYSIE